MSIPNPKAKKRKTRCRECGTLGFCLTELKVLGNVVLWCACCQKNTNQTIV